MKFTKSQNAGLRRIVASDFDINVFKYEANLNLNLKGFLLIDDKKLTTLLKTFRSRYKKALPEGEDAALEALKSAMSSKEIFVNTNKSTLEATIPLLIEDCKGVIIPRAYKLVNALGDNNDYENELVLSWIIDRVKGYWTNVWFNKNFKTRTGFRNQKVPYFLFLILIKNKIKNQVRTMQMQFSKRPDTSTFKISLNNEKDKRGLNMANPPSADILDRLEYKSLFDYCFAMLKASPVQPAVVDEIINNYKEPKVLSTEAKKMFKLYLYKAGHKTAKVIQFVNGLPGSVRAAHDINEDELSADVDKYC